MLDLRKIRLFRMIHIENMPHLLQYGITHSGSENANPNFKPIGDGSLISSRTHFKLRNGKLLGDYIPFYFGGRMPMLYVVQKGFNMVTPTPATEIVYCITTVQQIIDLQLDYVFTDGHAIDGFTMQYSADDIQQINSILDWNAINAKYWIDENDLDLKRRKEAEFLVLGDIHISAVLAFLVSNENTKRRLITLGADAAKVYVRPGFYF